MLWLTAYLMGLPPTGLYTLCWTHGQTPEVLCSVDQRSEKMGYKIREARLARVPYMLIVGAKEEEEGKVSVRSRYLGDEGMKDLDEFLTSIKEEIKNKTIRKIEVQEENK